MPTTNDQPKPVPTTYYYVLHVGRHTRKGQVDAPNLGKAMQQIGQAMADAEIDLREGRIDFSVYRLH